MAAEIRCCKVLFAREITAVWRPLLWNCLNEDAAWTGSGLRTFVQGVGEWMGTLQLSESYCVS